MLIFIIVEPLNEQIMAGRIKKAVQIGILAISDRASKGEYQDLSGKAIREVLGEYLCSDWEPVYDVVPDDFDLIKKRLMRMADVENCCLILTTGGTQGYYSGSN